MNKYNKQSASKTTESQQDPARSPAYTSERMGASTGLGAPASFVAGSRWNPAPIRMGTQIAAFPGNMAASAAGHHVGYSMNQGINEHYINNPDHPVWQENERMMAERMTPSQSASQRQAVQDDIMFDHGVRSIGYGLRDIGLGAFSDVFATPGIYAGSWIDPQKAQRLRDNHSRQFPAWAHAKQEMYKPIGWTLDQLDTREDRNNAATGLSFAIGNAPRFVNAGARYLYDNAGPYAKQMGVGGYNELFRYFHPFNREMIYYRPEFKPFTLFPKPELNNAFLSLPPIAVVDPAFKADSVFAQAGAAHRAYQTAEEAGNAIQNNKIPEVSDDFGRKLEARALTSWERSPDHPDNKNTTGWGMYWSRLKDRFHDGFSSHMPNYSHPDYRYSATWGKPIMTAAGTTAGLLGGLGNVAVTPFQDAWNYYVKGNDVTQTYPKAVHSPGIEERAVNTLEKGLRPVTNTLHVRQHAFPWADEIVTESAVQDVHQAVMDGLRARIPMTPEAEKAVDARLFAMLNSKEIQDLPDLLIDPTREQEKRNLLQKLERQALATAYAVSRTVPDRLPPPREAIEQQGRRPSKEPRPIFDYTNQQVIYPDGLIQVF